MSRQTFFPKNRIFPRCTFKKLKTILRKLSCISLSLSLALAPTTSFGSVLQLLHFEWNYDTTLPDLAGYTMYQDGQPIFDVNDPTMLNSDWDVTLESGTNSFTMTAFDAFGNESAHSVPYTLEVPPEDAIGNIPPIANIQASVTSGDLPLSVNFDATGSVDYGGSIVAYSWDYGDGNIDSGSTVSNTFWNGGTFTVTLTVTDDEGATSSSQTAITVTDPNGGQNNSPTAAITVSASSGEAPFPVNFDGTSSSDSDGSIVAYSWDFGDGNTATGDLADHTYLSAGTYTATLTVTDNEGTTGSAQASIMVTEPVIPNIPPTAAITASSLSGNSPFQVSFNGTASSDTDGSIADYLWDFGDGNSASGSSVSHQFVSGGTYTVTLAVTDNSGDTDQDQISIVVNSTPVAGAAGITTTEDTATSATLSATDAENNPLTYSIVTNGSKGTAIITNAATGNFTYTPNANANGSDSFTFKANDGQADSNTATISVTITAVNDLPIAVDDSAVTNEDTPATISVLANDTDVDGDTLTVNGVTQGNNGSVTTNTTTVTYTPAANWSGADSFTYTISDNNGGTDTATISVTVTSGNDTPVAADDTATTNEDTAVTVSVLDNDSDADNDSLTVTSVTQGTNGSVTTNGAAVTYTPNANANGTDSFTYTVDDGNGGTDTATVNITVSPINDIPAANNISVVTNEDTAAGGLLSATDADNDTMTYSIVLNGSKGTATITNTSTGAFTYTPNANISGTDSFTFKVNDGQADSNIATVSVTINTINDIPQASTASITTTEDTAVDATLSATDAENDALTYSIVTNGSKGTAIITNAATGNFTYTPNANANGSDSFTFKANDGQADSNIATITVSITAVNDLPIAVDDSAVTNEDTPATISVLANDTDVDGDTLTVNGVTQGNNGSVTTNTTTVTYTPAANWFGTDSFTYTVTDGNGSTDSATVTINVNDIPIANSDGFTIDEDTVATGNLIANDQLGNALVHSIVNNASKGSVSLNPATGAFTYTPNPNANGSDSFTFKVNDGQADSNTATIDITIIPVNDPPIATEDSGTTAIETQVSIAVLSNDNDVDGDALTVSFTTQGANGSVATDGVTVTYMPNQNFYGSDSFTYVVSDGHGGIAETNVMVTVSAPSGGKPSTNTAPIARDGLLTTSEDSPVNGKLTADDNDGDPLTYSIVNNGSMGSATLTDITTGAFVYLPSKNVFGTDTVTFKANDGQSDSNPATVTITINPVNDLPVTSPDAVIINEDTQVGINVLANDRDDDGDALSVGNVTQGDYGSTSISNNKVIYSPERNFHGQDSFTYEITDGRGGIATETVTITILPINDAPNTYEAALVITEDTILDSTLPADDPDGDILTYTIVDNPAKGKLSITDAETGTYIYTPNTNSTGTDAFTFTVDDGKGGIADGLVNIIIVPANDTPLAVDDKVFINDYKEMIGKLQAHDADNDTLTYAIVDSPAKGQLSYFDPETGSYVYTPNADGTETDLFTFTANDGETESDPAAITVVFNQSPVAIANGPYSGVVNSPITFDAGNSYDPDGTIALYEWDWDNDGIFDESAVSPKTSHLWTEPFSGSITLRVTDNNGITSMDSASVSITILGDLDSDNITDKDDSTIFRDRFRAANKSCTGDSNFDAELDLDADGCITKNDAGLMRTLASTSRQ